MNTGNTEPETARGIRVLSMGSPSGQGEDQDPQEGWLTYVSVMSAQGARCLTWSPVPGDTVAGDLFVLRMPSLSVPRTIRQEMLSSRSGEGGRESESLARVISGTGELASLMDMAKERLGFGPFGSELDSQEIRIARHPVFDPYREELEQGLYGLALAHGDARTTDGGSFEARLGTVVPFPDVVSGDAVRNHFGGAWDELDSLSAPSSGLFEYALPKKYLGELRRFLMERFSDPQLDDAVLRLFEMSTRMCSRREAYPESLQPLERWDFKSSREWKIREARRRKDQSMRERDARELRKWEERRGIA